MSASSRMSESMEDYVEVMWELLNEKQVVRARDVADRMAVRRPSVTGALRALAREGMIDHQPYDVIALTKRGRELGREVLGRHVVLKDFFVSILGAGERDAEEAACSMEHVVSKDILRRLVRFLAQAKTCPVAKRCRLGRAM